MLLDGGVDRSDGEDAGVLVGTVALLPALGRREFRYRWRGAICDKELSLALFCYQSHFLRSSFVHYPVDLVVPHSFLLLDIWIVTVFVIDPDLGGFLLARVGYLVKKLGMASMVVRVQQTCWRQQWWVRT